jgi:hypothetical protein
MNNVNLSDVEKSPAITRQQLVARFQRSVIRRR